MKRESQLPKGNGVNIPRPGRIERGVGGVFAHRPQPSAQSGNTLPHGRRRRTAREEFSFLLDGLLPLEADYPEKGLRGRESSARLALSGACPMVLENPVGGINLLLQQISVHSWPYPSPHQVSKVNSL